MIDFEKQIDALLARQIDLKRRQNEIVDEMREIVEEYARIGREAARLRPHLLGPINLLVEQLRANVATMRKVPDG